MATATMGPPTTVGAEARFPQRQSICWTLRSAHTGAGWKGGGWRNDAMGTDDDGNNSGVIKERSQTGRGKLLTRPGGRSTWLPVIA